uniref:Uncharacterized protein n=1 Tax=Haematobia irritans TaxID=7368 RepID=A0A1L8EAE6_HAEIR
MDSPKLKNISVRVKRAQHPDSTSMDEVRDQVSMKRCTVRLQRYNDEELRQMALNCRSVVLKEDTSKPKNIRNMVVRVRRLVDYGIPVQ